MWQYRKPNDIKETEEKRVGLIQGSSKLIRAYSNVANEMHKLEYSESEANKIKEASTSTIQT